MAVKYTCPDCGSVLKPAKPVAAGKKIKCPECGTIFAPAAAGAAPAKAAVAAKPKPTDDDDDEGGSYAVAAEESGDKADKRDLHFGSLRDKYPKSKRGPAMAACVRPANTIMLAGAIICLASVVGAFVAIFPMIFTTKPAATKAEFGTTPNGAKASVPTSLSPAELRQQFLYLLGAFVGFGWGAMVCAGASKMQSLESYKWAMAGSVMAIPLLAGLWGIAVLRDEAVIAGFEETPPPPSR